MMKRILFLLLATGLLITATTAAHAKSFNVQIAAGEHNRVNTPISVLVTLPQGTTSANSVSLADAAGNTIAGQLTAPSIAADVKKGEGKVAQLNFILPKLAAGESATFTATIGEADTSATQYQFKENGKLYDDLLFGDRPVLRYMREPVDDSSAERRSATFKVYHHVYDPSGKVLLTKGPGGLFPHHRGLFYGFNRISYEGKSADVWHCRNGESQSHEETVLQETGPVLGRHVVKIAWRGKDGKPFANELRELTAWNTPGGQLIEFASRLETEEGEVKLDGDPQHAGFQFRATQAVPDKTKGKTYYLRPDGKGEPGKFRNWGKGNTKHANLAWNSLSFVLNDKRYSVSYLDRPTNPKEARFSERDYGRFGSYFEYTLTEENPLQLRYRVWVEQGEKTVEEVNALSTDFVEPPEAKATAA